jgi:hypothetical protein
MKLRNWLHVVADLFLGLLGNKPQQEKEDLYEKFCLQYPYLASHILHFKRS